MLIIPVVPVGIAVVIPMSEMAIIIVVEMGMISMVVMPVMRRPRSPVYRIVVIIPGRMPNHVSRHEDEANHRP